MRNTLPRSTRSIVDWAAWFCPRAVPARIAGAPVAAPAPAANNQRRDSIVTSRPIMSGQGARDCFFAALLALATLSLRAKRSNLVQHVLPNRQDERMPVN